MEYFYDQMIGNLSYDIVEIMLSKKISICNAVENEYNIIKTPIGFILIYSNEDAPKFKFGIKLINRRKIPKDLNLEYLINQNNSSKLTKKLIPTKNNN